LSYDPATGVLTLDYTTLPRVSTDNGLWSAALPKKVAVGEKLTLHLFLDGSIVDIFVNDTWAFSTRIFPTDAEAIAAEAFGADNASIKGWVLDAKQTASNIGATLVNNGIVNSAVYDLQGRMLSPLTSKKRLSVSLTGNCITSEETLLKQFPIRVNDHIRLSTNRFDLGRMRKGESKERGVVVLYSDTKRQERIPVRFTVDSKTPKGLQHIAYPLEIKGKKVMITLDVFVY
jgi:beta-fructofuranosidase